MKEGELTSSPLAVANTRCLLLVPRGFDAPLDLLDGLRRRRVTVQEVGDAPAVMVALATGATAGAFAAVVLVEPDSIRDAPRLIETIKRHHPVAIWRYAYDAHPRLTRLYNPPAGARPMTPSDAPVRASRAPTEPPRASSLAQPIRRAAERHVSGASDVPDPSDAPDASQAELSPDELAMLLGHDEPTDPEGGEA